MNPAQIRAAQLLADHGQRPWTLPELAERARSDTPSLEDLRERLVGLGLVSAGASVQVRDVRGMRIWLVREDLEPLRVWCRVEDRDELPSTLEGVDLVLTGAAGAWKRGYPVLTTIPLVLVRAAVPDVELVEFARLLGDVGPGQHNNVMLLGDEGRVAREEAEWRRSAWVAPMSRVASDLRYDVRGESAQRLLLDLWSDDVV